MSTRPWPDPAQPRSGRHRPAPHGSKLAPLFVDDLAFEGSLVRHCAVEGILIGAIVDFEKKIALLNALIVGDVQVQYRPLDDGGNSDVVGKDFSVIGLGMLSRD
jgi:hypothetical protein